jgi:hypothetical protein
MFWLNPTYAGIPELSQSLAVVAQPAIATTLEMAGGRPQQAGWLDWDDISEEWSDEKEAHSL